MKWTQKHSENLANQGQVILPPELRKNALLISQSGSSNFDTPLWHEALLFAFLIKDLVSDHHIMHVQK